MTESPTEAESPIEEVMASVLVDHADDYIEQLSIKDAFRSYSRILRQLPRLWRAIDLEKSQEGREFPSARRMKIGFTAILVIVPPLGYVEEKLHIPPPRRKD